MANDSLPLVSVIIPAFNHERYVTECLDSVLNEEYPNKEIIIVDDGSTDRTLEKIEEWVKLHQNAISVLVHSQRNLGISAAFNHTLPLAKGDFVVPIASDDLLISGGIRKRLNYLQDHPDLLAVFGDCHAIDSDSIVTHQSCLRELYYTDPRCYATPSKVAFRVAWRWGIPGPVLMARRTLYEKIGDYDEARRVEDWDFYLRMASIQTLGFIDEPVSSYRRHLSNASLVPGRQAFILSELAKSGFKRAHLFNNPVLRLIVLAKACYFAFRAQFSRA